jgi:hypothetical protein
VSSYSDEFKYSKTPTDSRVDRLEDRIDRQDRLLNPAMAPAQQLIDKYHLTNSIEEVQAEYFPGSNDMKAISSMPNEQESIVVKPLVAEDFRRYIGQIVHDISYDQYAEVIEIVGNYVAILRSPIGDPVLTGPGNLRLF